MSIIHISHLAAEPLTDYLISRGHILSVIQDDPRLGDGVGAHADLRMCKLGAVPESPIVFASRDDYSGGYPNDAAMCAVCLDKYIIHRTDITSPALLSAALSLGLTPVNVRQGYAKCGCVAVDGRSIITSDDGICSALSDVPDIDVLKISPGHVLLPGFPYGFLGGASGRIGDEIVFNGDLSAHPDFAAIEDFLCVRGLKLRYFAGYELTDIGSVIEEHI